MGEGKGEKVGYGRASLLSNCNSISFSFFSHHELDTMFTVFTVTPPPTLDTLFPSRQILPIDY